MIYFGKWNTLSKNKINFINSADIIIIFFLIILIKSVLPKREIKDIETWPDGTPISPWFSDTSRVDISGFKRYIITEYGVEEDNNLVQTEKIQAVIDLCSQEGGGVIVIPNGTFISGSLFFRPKTHL